jgi:hypothetical protein
MFVWVYVDVCVCVCVCLGLGWVVEWGCGLGCVCLCVYELGGLISWHLTTVPPSFSHTHPNPLLTATLQKKRRVFRDPEALIVKEGARIMSLLDGTSKVG